MQYDLFLSILYVFLIYMLHGERIEYFLNRETYSFWRFIWELMQPGLYILAVSLHQSLTSLSFSHIQDSD